MAVDKSEGVAEAELLLADAGHRWVLPTKSRDQSRPGNITRGRAVSADLAEWVLSPRRFRISNNSSRRLFFSLAETVHGRQLVND
jgi:hypothetical protein